MGEASYSRFRGLHLSFRQLMMLLRLKQAMRESRFGVNNLAFEWLLEIGLKVLASVDNRARREDFVNSLLEQCCKDGYLSGKFISMIRSLEMDERSAADEGKDEIFNKYLQRPPFPATWTRNISVN